MPIFSLGQKQLLCSKLFTVQQDSDCLFSDWTASAVADEDLHMRQGQNCRGLRNDNGMQALARKYQGTQPLRALM